MKFEALREQVCQANKQIVQAGLVVLTWGNVSGVDRKEGVMAIKPSGVEYDKLTPKDIVILSIEDGSIQEGQLRPSSDTPTHLQLYRSFPMIGGVVHTHSNHATSFAQAGKSIPCLGTTHSDHFYGQIPVTRPMLLSEVEEEYELHTGTVIVECFRKANLNPEEVPAVLVQGHGPFTWGPDAAHAVENAIVLEEIASMAFKSMVINHSVGPIPYYLLDKHFLRKHGPGAYYGQKDK